MRRRFEIIFEDDDVLVVNKPPGLLSSTVPHEKRPTLLALVDEYLADTHPDARIGLIHRLDRDASGLMIFSKNPGAYHSLKEQFFRHTVDRIYHAIVAGVPDPARAKIKTTLIEQDDGRVRSGPGGKEAITQYQTLRTTSDGKFSLLRVKLHTGKKHQIRAHLSERGWPIVNDPVYVKKKRKGRLMLIASELAFDHPRGGKRVKLTVAIPREMSSLLK